MPKALPHKTLVLVYLIGLSSDVQGNSVLLSIYFPPFSIPLMSSCSISIAKTITCQLIFNHFYMYVFIMSVFHLLACRELGTYRSETRCTCVDNNRGPACQRQQIFTRGMENNYCFDNRWFASCNEALQKGVGCLAFKIRFDRIFFCWVSLYHQSI